MTRLIAISISLIHAFFWLFLISSIPILVLGPQHGCHELAGTAIFEFWVNPACSILRQFSK